jgi:hypothetical protein
LESFRELRSDPFKPRNLALMLGIGSFVDADYPEFVSGLDPRVHLLTDRSDWTAPRVLETGVAGKPTLLLLRDSFSLAMLPFLEGHFSRIILVHHQEGFWRPDLIERWKPDVVVLEVIESGLPFAMSGGPPADDEARRRIDLALAAPHRLRERPPRPGKTIEGGARADRLSGGVGDDTLRGRQGDDRIYGRAGDDTAVGGRGNDLVDGGPGNDWLTGGRGDDTLTGGGGADTFLSFPGAGGDLVTDFSAAEGDQVQLPAVDYSVRQEGADTVVEMTGARLVLRNVRLSSLPQGWLRVR